jgi:ATP-dependent exoDNAse (exonuclease V) alpha subunit
MAGMSDNPFKIGDKVQFVPNERAQGWSWFGPGTIQPNDIGIISRIQDRDYLYIKCIDSSPDGKEVGGFYWSCFRQLG